MATPPRARIRSFAAALAMVTAVAACGDSNGPATITDPTATIRDLIAVDSAFQTDAFGALTLLVGHFPGPAAAGPLARLGTALGVTLPPRPALSAGTLLPRSVAPQDLRTLAGLADVAVIPDTLLGTTFEWNADSLRYLATARAGAPPNGIRFILYRANTTTGYPDPAQEVGTLDIIDLAPAVGAELQFVVRGTSGAPTFLDYTLSFLPAAQAFTVQASGYLSNGRPGTLERRFTFDAAITSTQTANGANETVDFVYDVNVPDVTVGLHLGSVSDTVKDTTTATIDYQFSRATEHLRLAGADTLTNGGADETATFAVTVNGNAYATLRIVNGTPTITDRTGAVVPLNGNDQHYEDDIVVALLFGVLDSAARLIVVLAIPALLLGFSVGLL